MRVLKRNEVKDISNQLLLPNGKLKLRPASDYHAMDWIDLRFFCHQYGRYGIPTIETIDVIKDLIGDRSAIEIGAGHGDLGYHLGIPMTDSHAQKKPEIKLMYEFARQPIIQYPSDIEELEAQEAIAKYKPQVVVGSWVTEKSKEGREYGFIYGVEEEKILDSVETYIIVGNIETHNKKSIRKFPHICIMDDYIVSRATNKNSNAIFIWNK